MFDGIPSRPGTYLLIFHSDQPSSVTVGRFGRVELTRGYYFYIGSAFGPGGLRARVRHHHGISKKPHWHLDYIRPSLSLLEIWYSVDTIRYEHAWADNLYNALPVQAPLPGLGASDCRCHSHFFYMRTKPDAPSILDALKNNNQTLNISIVRPI